MKKRPEPESQSDWLNKNSPHFWRMKKYQKLLRNFKLKNKKVLDVGCGEGNLLSMLSFSRNFGVDTEKAYLKKASSKNPQAHFRLASAEKLPFAENYFDLVCCTEVIEHLKNPKNCLKEIRRVLKPKGIFLVSTYNHFYLFNLLTLRALSPKPIHQPGHLREYQWISFIKFISQYFKIKKLAQAGSTRFLNSFFCLTKLPLADFMIILAIKEK